MQKTNPEAGCGNVFIKIAKLRIYDSKIADEKIAYNEGRMYSDVTMMRNAAQILCFIFSPKMFIVCCNARVKTLL